MFCVFCTYRSVVLRVFLAIVYTELYSVNSVRVFLRLPRGSCRASGLALWYGPTSSGGGSVRRSAWPCSAAWIPTMAGNGAKFRNGVTYIGSCRYQLGQQLPITGLRFSPFNWLAGELGAGNCSPHFLPTDQKQFFRQRLRHIHPPGHHSRNPARRVPY